MYPAISSELDFMAIHFVKRASQLALVVKNLPANAGDIFLDREDPLEEGMATHSSIIAWRTPWTEDPGGLQSMGSQTDMTKVT